jgi:hypothetical protein
MISPSSSGKGLKRFFLPSPAPNRLELLRQAADLMKQSSDCKKKAKLIMALANKTPPKMPDHHPHSSSTEKKRASSSSCDEDHHHATLKPPKKQRREGYILTSIKDSSSSSCYERAKYLATTSVEILEMMRLYGVAVVPNVLTTSEAQAAWREMYTALEYMYDGFAFHDKSTWGLLRRAAQHGMLFQHLGIGWSQFAVNLRQNPKVAGIFAGLWSEYMSTPITVNDLFSSADGVSFYCNTPTERGGWHSRESMHLDQAASSLSSSWQGALNLVETKRNDACFSFLEGSHLHFEEFMLRLSNQAKIDGFSFDEHKRFTLLENQAQLNFYVDVKKCAPKRMMALPGDLVLWSSKTVHSEIPALRPAVPMDPSTVFLRGGVYVSYQPKAFATPSDIKKKIKAYNEYRNTTHDAAVGVTLFQKAACYGRSCDTVIRPVSQKPVLTALGSSLFAVPSL